MDPEKQARLEATGFHVTDDPRDLLNPLAVIKELREERDSWKRSALGYHELWENAAKQIEELKARLNLT